jgi:hypothetical protein
MYYVLFWLCPFVNTSVQKKDATNLTHAFILLFVASISKNSSTMSAIEETGGARPTALASLSNNVSNNNGGSRHLTFGEILIYSIHTLTLNNYCFFYHLTFDVRI